jgi:hypothetical protein
VGEKAKVDVVDIIATTAADPKVATKDAGEHSTKLSLRLGSVHHLLTLTTVMKLAFSPN